MGLNAILSGLPLFVIHLEFRVSGAFNYMSKSR